MFDQHPDWCRLCGKVGCDCVYCHGARFVRTAASPDLIRCDACNPTPEPESAPTPSNVVRLRRGRAYAERLDS